MCIHGPPTWHRPWIWLALDVYVIAWSWHTWWNDVTTLPEGVRAQTRGINTWVSWTLTLAMWEKVQAVQWQGSRTCTSCGFAQTSPPSEMPPPSFKAQSNVISLALSDFLPPLLIPLPLFVPSSSSSCICQMAYPYLIHPFIDTMYMPRSIHSLPYIHVSISAVWADTRPYS